MLPICFICLRKNSRLFTLQDDLLYDFYDELCDYRQQGAIRCCEQCYKRLKSFYNFKSRCQNSMKILLTWRKQKKSGKKSLKRLHEDMPTANSHLGLSNRNNFKIYFFQAVDSNVFAPIQVIDSKHPHIVTITIPHTDGDTEESPKSPLETNNDNVNENNDNRNENNDNWNENNDNRNENNHNRNENNDNRNDNNDKLNENNDNRTENNDNVNSVEIKEEAIEFVAFDDNAETVFADDINPEMIDTKVTVEIEHLNKDEDMTQESDVDSDTSFDKFIAQYKEKAIKREKPKEKNSKPKNTSDLEDSDSSIDEFLSKYSKITSKITKSNAKKSKVKGVFNWETVKNKLREKFQNSDSVKDAKGNVIDIKVVERFLDKLPIYKLKGLFSLCGGPGPFSPKAIHTLSKLHKQYLNYQQMAFSLEYIHDDAQVKADFEKRRESLEYVESEHRCESCIKGFKSKEMLEHHNKSFHDKSKPLECFICKMRFTKKMVLQGHTRRHRMLHKCGLCPFVTRHRGGMTQHYHRHIGVKCICQFCGEEFTNKSAMYLHYGRSHNPTHPCELCAFSSFTKPGLQQHKNFKHSGEEFIKSNHNKKCDECDVTFLNEDVYKKHLSISHGVQTESSDGTWLGSFACHLCNYRGENPWGLSRHMRALHPNEPAPATKKSPDLNAYLCDTCGKSFRYRQFYNDHMNTHTGARPYVCTQCPKTFHARKSLWEHKQRHLPPTVACPYCGKMFASYTTMYHHKRSHVGDRRFKCDICDKGFLTKAELRNHNNRVHSSTKEGTV